MKAWKVLQYLQNVDYDRNFAFWQLITQNNYKRVQSSERYSAVTVRHTSYLARQQFHHDKSGDNHKRHKSEGHQSQLPSVRERDTECHAWNERQTCSEQRNATGGGQSI